MLRRSALLAATNSGPADGPIVTAGLALNLDAGNSASYSGSGTTWTDLSGNGNNGAMANTTYSSANSGSIVFNGSTAYVNLGDPTTLRFGTGDWSLEYWIRFSSMTNSISAQDTVFSKLNAGFESFWYTQKFANYIATSGSTPTTYGNTSDWALNTWYHVVYSKTSGLYAFYKNASFYAQVANTGSVSNVGTSWRIGQRSSGGFPFNGRLSVARMYNVGLTAANVSQNFNALRGRYGI